MLLLKKEEMQRVYSMKEAIEAVKLAFKLFSEGKATVPLRTNIDVPKGAGGALFMPAYVEETESLGVKIVSVFPNNVKVGRPAVPATMVLLEPQTGEVCAIMDGTYLTQLRTGAAAGAATDLLSRKDASVGAIIGAGGQALYQLEAMLTVRELKEIRVFDVDAARAQSLVRSAGEIWGKKGVRIALARSPEEAVDGADVITTVTTSKAPVFPGAKVKDGAHVNGIGSYTPQMQELPPDLLKRADRVFVDSREAVLSEAGDFIIPIKEGLFDASIISGEIGELVAAHTRGRSGDGEITVFKTVGIGVQDVVTAREIYKRALEAKVGSEVSL